MAKFFNWLKSTTGKLIDPNRDVILRGQAQGVEDCLYRDHRSFDLDSVCAAFGVLPEDVPWITAGIYQRAAERAWADQVVTEKERRSLDRIATLLKVSPARQREAELSIGLDIFERALSGVTSDGVIDEADAQRLNSIAASCGSTTRDLILNHFAEHGEGIVRSMFASISEDGRVDPEEWDRLVHASGALGLDSEDVRAIVRAQAQPFVEHVLAEAKADGRLTREEKLRLEWLLSILELPSTFRAYVTNEVVRLELFEAIAQGRPPSIPCDDTALRAGEIAHFRGTATYHYVRQLKSGPRYEPVDGEMLVTDTRFIFASALKTVDVSHRRIVSVVPAHHGFELRCSGKGAGVYWSADAALAYAILQAAVGRANQTIVDVRASVPTRHIHRDVRQRVWQKYGGRCAECGATQYLEFDHIIPHAKGGSNDENNVQLLCRGCNGKKSDMI
jgi:tellurite resistance protein